MDKNKMSLFILTALLVLVVGYAIYSRNDSFRQINKITTQMNEKVDSINLIRMRYDSLSIQYDYVYARLDSTNAKFKLFKNHVDSITHARINSLSIINNALKEAIERSDLPVVIDTTKTEFRFQ